ncbi:hypothetical protein PMZ80_007410 [Knufia obscura]|uniref:Tryptophan synthase beta chain-like PALP domain-containing protein n=1 Tax=Knufia obscura TaxID=1635080 RepID=A0ABR0RH81_9EURO|nr:hypothetical protein PMZ80_007410 [Knufia obscura]
MINLPTPFSNLPVHRLSYAHPSPIHLLPNLTQYANNLNVDQSSSGVRLWTKREDQAGPLTCYGNKYRKFEYIIPDILARKNVTTIVTEGAIQSNHTVQVASVARILGLKCTVLLHRGIGGLRIAKDKDAFAKVGNVQLNKLLGADVRITDESDTGDEKAPLIPILDELRAQGQTPYWISSGASLHPLGGLGYARCAFEIASQEQQLATDQRLGGSKQFDYIFVACGSGSTLAGLIAGFKLHEKVNHAEPAVTFERKIVGILTSPTKSRSHQEERILRLARTAGGLIGLDPETDITEADVHLDERFVGRGYGLLDADTAETLDLAARTDSLLLDPVYTAKALRGMLDWAQSAQALQKPAGAHQTGPVNALFIHTGGQSALSAYADGCPIMLPNQQLEAKS